MTERKWSPDASVVVCGVENGRVTSNGLGSQEFPNLSAAQAVFPDLDPHKNTERFTCAMGDPKSDKMRFETHAAYKVYST